MAIGPSWKQRLYPHQYGPLRPAYDPYPTLLTSFFVPVDRVLTFPTTLAVTAASTHLSYLAAGMIPGSFLQPTNFSVDISTRPNTTIFGPNSVSAVLDIPLNASQSFYSNLFEYHCISKLVYSSELVNGTVLPTFNGKNITIRVDGEGGLWANNARVIGKDYLLSNGVLHVLDG